MFSSMKPREKLLVGVIGTLLVSWGVLSFVLEPLLQKHKDIALEIEAQQAQLQTLSKLLAKGDQIARQYEAYDELFVLDEGELAQGIFLNEIESLASSNTLQLNLKPRPVKANGKLSRFEVECDLEGTQEDLLRFMDGILQMPRLLNLKRIRIAASAKSGQGLRANLVIERLSFGSSETTIR